MDVTISVRSVYKFQTESLQLIYSDTKIQTNRFINYKDKSLFWLIYSSVIKILHFHVPVYCKMDLYISESKCTHPAVSNRTNDFISRILALTSFLIYDSRKSKQFSGRSRIIRCVVIFPPFPSFFRENQTLLLCSLHFNCTSPMEFHRRSPN